MAGTKSLALTTLVMSGPEQEKCPKKNNHGTVGSQKGFTDLTGLSLARNEMKIYVCGGTKHEIHAHVLIHH